jgi:hypothetical protein
MGLQHMPRIITAGRENPNELHIFLGTLTDSESDAVYEFMPQVLRELQREWPVKGYSFLKRNPHKPDATETTLILLFLSPLLKALGEQLRDAVLRKVKLLLKGKVGRASRKVGSKAKPKGVAAKSRRAPRSGAGY